jgi:hypothetical protein
MVGEATSTTAGEVIPMMVGDAVSMSMLMVGDAVSMSMVGDAVSMSMVGDALSMSMLMVGDVVSMSMWMVGDAVSMSMWMVGDAESTAVAGDEPLTLVGVGELMEDVNAGKSMVVGEGAGESVYPDPVVPTVGAN